MSQELIQALRRTKLDAIVGEYYGGNDQGGITQVHAVILKPEYPVEKWPCNDKLSEARELSMEINIHGHYKGGKWISECSFVEKQAGDIARAGVPEGLDLWKLFIEPFEEVIDSNYGSFAGDFTVNGEFYATRDGRFSVTDSISTESWEDQTLASECHV